MAPNAQPPKRPSIEYALENPDYLAVFKKVTAQMANGGNGAAKHFQKMLKSDKGNPKQIIEQIKNPNHPFTLDPYDPSNQTEASVVDPKAFNRNERRGLSETYKPSEHKKISRRRFLKEAFITTPLAVTALITYYKAGEHIDEALKQDAPTPEEAKAKNEPRKSFRKHPGIMVQEDPAKKQHLKDAEDLKIAALLSGSGAAIVAAYNAIVSRYSHWSISTPEEMEKATVQFYNDVHKLAQQVGKAYEYEKGKASTPRTP